MWVREKADRDHMQAAERCSSTQSPESGARVHLLGPRSRRPQTGRLTPRKCLASQPEVAAGLFPPEDYREVRPSLSPGF